jgi:hypothetical protein
MKKSSGCYAGTIYIVQRNKMITKKQSIYILLALSFCITCGTGCVEKKVHDAKGTLPELPSIDVSEPNRFLNDLMLSPLWKVAKKRDGSFIAEPRSIGRRWFFDGENSFLFEFMANPNNKLPKDYQIYNRYLHGDKSFSSFQVYVVFQQLDLTRVTLGESGQEVTLGVYEPYEDRIGPNSSSYLAIKLSSQHDIYVLLHEQGADTERKTTFAKVLPTMKELSKIADSPEVYRCEDRYEAFFELFFSLPLKNEEIKRFPGLQDRDIFYGYLRTKPNVNYAGVNIKISHPVYCPDEGTRKYERLRKAEYPGKPYQDGDILFFLIEDNAVYLSGEYDQRFGTFTGKESFEGTLEVLNENAEVLLKTTEKFKGWQR